MQIISADNMKHYHIYPKYSDTTRKEIVSQLAKVGA